MSFDNRQFRINGPMSDRGSLESALEIACRLAGSIGMHPAGTPKKIIGWLADCRGLLLFDYIPTGSSVIPTAGPLNAREAMVGLVEPYMSQRPKVDLLGEPCQGCECLIAMIQGIKADENATIPEGYRVAIDGLKPHRDRWDTDADHDGSNVDGWTIYLDRWGHVGDATCGVICAIKPTYCWLGK